MMPLERLLPSWPAYHERLMCLGPMGYTLALNVRYLTPQIYVSTYPDIWVTEYTKGRYVLLDPVALWCAAHSGNIRWSDISVPSLVPSKRGVMAKASRAGLRYGAVSSQRNRDLSSQRCALSISREDREVENAELEEIADILAIVMEHVGPFGGLTADQLAVISELAKGHQLSEVANRLSVSEPTVKRRLESARKSLGAKTAMQAVAIVSARGLLGTSE